MGSLHNVHLDGEVGSEQPTKEGEQHSSERGQLHERTGPLVTKVMLGHSRPFLDE
jgi:hypothetical protein